MIPFRFASPQDDFCNGAILDTSCALTAEPIAEMTTPKKTKILLIYLINGKIHTRRLMLDFLQYTKQQKYNKVSNNYIISPVFLRAES